MNSVISWVGDKKTLQELIYIRMPKEFGRYIEVFGAEVGCCSDALPALL